MPDPKQFINSVLALRPSIAVFDCDGTLWSNNSGEDFYYWSLEPGRGLVSDEVVKWAYPRYDAYLRGEVGEEEMCGEMTSMYAGAKVATLEQAAANFFAAKVRSNYFLEMKELTCALAEQGCELWAVSSTNEWVIREGIEDFRIPAANALAASVEINGGIATDRLIRVPSGPAKATAIREIIGRPVDAVFGNSIHDAAMLELAKHPFAVNPNPDLEKLAASRGWPVYWPERAVAGTDKRV